MAVPIIAGYGGKGLWLRLGAGAEKPVWAAGMGKRAGVLLRRYLPAQKTGGFCEKSGTGSGFHLAAQPLVSVGYAQPARTYETNLMGTVYLMEALRKAESLRSVVVVTTDKVYAETKEAAGEESPLDGFDPYANSKSCEELAAACYGRCFLQGKAALSCLRAGNVIGGGDFAAHRILPDCVRAAVARKPVVLRHPEGVRPYQHVLEPLTAYLWTAWKQWDAPELADCYNVAPKGEDISNGELAGLFCKYWGNGMTWQAERTDFPREQAVLRLNGEKYRKSWAGNPAGMWSRQFRQRWHGRRSGREAAT